MPFPVVGIGASAGGLEAIRGFFSTMPADSGMAFVLIPHLDPTHRSQMVELVTRQTRMPVCEVTEGLAIQVNCVYIIPPNKLLTVQAGCLRLGKTQKRDAFEAALDGFFRSLAGDQQELAIGIILSGTGSHGISGLKEIKLAGGIVVAQAPDTAQYEQMPRNVIESGLMDYVLPPEQMSQALLSYIQQPYLHTQEPLHVSPEFTEQIGPILDVLRSRSRYDFRCYRKNMLSRRILRRMGICQIEEVSAYRDHLLEHPAEITALYRDLLIGITSFFRDPQAFEALSLEVLAEQVRRQSGEIPLRVWVAACATGEEAYSIAMLLVEQFHALNKPANFQIFASDIDEESVDVARRGLYPASSLSELSPERIQQFFVKTDDLHYQVSKQLRGFMVVTRQNAISDPPFSRLDLICCRNLLIYLEPEMQQQLIARFHFALRERGILFLGCSESIGRQTDLFEPISKKWRIFRRLGRSRHDLIPVPLATTPGYRIGLPTLDPGPRGRSDYGDLLQKLLLARYAPAAVLMNRKYEVVSLSGRTSDYLELPTGELTRNLLSLLRKGLRTRIRAACHRVLGGGEPEAVVAARLQRHGATVACTISVTLLREPREADGLLLVVFHDRIDEPPARGAPSLITEDESAVVRQLEYEVETTREDLQGTIEELQSSNEEVISMNEELQSSNEELETSKEELQSVNEELNTVNSQLQYKVDELEAANSDFRNLLNSSEIATLFLDSDLRIRRFTPATVQLLQLIESDIGRPIRDFALRFTDQTLLQDAGRVLDQGIRVETEIHSEQGRTYLRRILPYRSSGDRIDGVILTFVDITEQRRNDAALLEVEQRMRVIVEAAADAILTINDQGLVESANPAAARIFGYPQNELIGLNLRLLLPVLDRNDPDASLIQMLQTAAKRPSDANRDLTGCRQDGSTFSVEVSIGELHSGPQHLFTCILRDVTESKALQNELLTIATEEQRRIGQELHDVLGQELTGLGLIIGGLADTLGAQKRPEAALARKATETTQRVLTQVRTQSRMLIPVEIEDPNGLTSALEELAWHIQQQFGVSCEFVCPQPVAVTNRLTAINLYHLAQEAVTNAIKHGHARRISISLEVVKAQMLLRIRDDGAGFRDAEQVAASGQSGLGLRIMRYRARVINGLLRFATVPEGGTIVTCTLPAELHVGVPPPA